VLFNNPGFGNGLGLRVHIRTKIETWWSYIEQAVVQIGDQMLQLNGGSNANGGPHYWVNGMPGQANVSEDPNLATLVEHEQFDAGFSVYYQKPNDKRHLFRIALNHAGDAITLHTYKDWLFVDVRVGKQQNFAGTMGLLGRFPSGDLVARDGVTVMTDTNAFGKEWQVLATETMLFHHDGAVIPAMECVMPAEKIAKDQQRRLGESFVSLEDAEAACAHVADQGHDDCVFDVMASEDIDMAGAY
jgi:hypothetical protein